MKDDIMPLAHIAARLGSKDLIDAVRNDQNAAGIEDPKKSNDSSNDHESHGEPSRTQPKTA